MQCALNGFCASTTASSMEDAAPLLLKDCCLQTGVDGSEYMPAKSIPKRSHPWQGWKSLGVQGNRIVINYSPTNHVFVQCVGEDDERILNHVIFYLVEFRCDSAIVSYWPRVITLGQHHFLNHRLNSIGVCFFPCQYLIKQNFLKPMP